MESDNIDATAIAFKQFKDSLVYHTIMKYLNNRRGVLLKTMIEHIDSQDFYKASQTNGSLQELTTFINFLSLHLNQLNQQKKGRQ